MSQSPSALSLHYTSYEIIDNPELEAQNREDGSDRKIQSTIQVLKEFFQSDDTIADLKACKALYDMMPEDQTQESWYDGMLASLILSTAEQIPHDNTAQNKLVRLMGELSRCDRFNVLWNRRWYSDPQGVGQLHLVYSNYVHLPVYARTWCEIFNGVGPQQYDSKYLNLCAFHARLSTAGIMDNTLDMFFTMRDVLEQPIVAETPEDLSIQIKMAAVWILHGGHLFYNNIVIDPEPTTARSSQAYQAYELYSGPIFGLERWGFWQARLSELSNHSDISEEACDLGRRAADLMASLARTVR